MIYFDTLHLYYLPQYLPIKDELAQRGVDCKFVIYRSGAQQSVLESFIKTHKLDCDWVDNPDDALNFYKRERPDWIIFGNVFDAAGELNNFCKTASVGHGIGPKSSYYDSCGGDIQVRFVEGQYRLQRLQNRFPDKTFIDTGYAKLDPLVNGSERGLNLSELGLDGRKQTLLYAPTFYPSSIENMDKNWPQQFEQYNILLKPHFFSLVKPRYKRQKQRLEHWAKFENVYLAPMEETNLLPFMATADLLISDASSALFEFAALNKPVVWCDFFKLRWTYRGPLRFRFTRRMDEDLYKYADVAAHASTFKQLKSVVDEQIANPQSFAHKRKAYIELLAGKVDGLASRRIVDYLLAH